MALQSGPDNILYQPLAKGQIRLLRIIEKKSDATHCQLDTVSLESLPSYCALSYEWAKYDDSDVGDPLPTVVVNSQAISTTRNLCLALRFLKSESLYWIDALCINQDDDDERGHQVRMMTRIYQSAAQVYAWLGLDNDQISLGMGLISQFAEDFYSSTLELEDSAIQRWTLKWLEAKLSDPKCRSQWDGFCQILGSSYWARLWIIQELVVCQDHREAKLKCGPQEVNFFHLGIILEGIDRLAQDTLKNGSIQNQKTLERVDGLSTLALFVFRDSVLWHNREQECMQLLELLRRYSSSLCSDSRDRVYALLGVELNDSREYLRVDYSVSEAEVYINAASYMIKSTGRLDVLCACRRPQNPLALPTWVPDWKLRSELRAANRGWNFGDRWYHEGCDASGGSSAFAEFSSRGKHLAVKSVLLGSIKNICLAPDWAPDGQMSQPVDSTLLNAQKCLYHWLSFAISVLEPLSLTRGSTLVDGSPSRRTLEIFYETVVEGYYGKERAVTWSMEDFISYCMNILEASDAIVASQWSKESTINLLLSVYKKLPLFEVDLFGQTLIKKPPQYDIDGNLESEVFGKAIGRCHLRSAQVGDVVAIVRGCSLPMLLRLTTEGYEVVCELYVHGYMDGEAMGCMETDIRLC